MNKNVCLCLLIKQMHFPVDLGKLGAPHKDNMQYTLWKYGNQLWALGGIHCLWCTHLDRQGLLTPLVTKPQTPKYQSRKWNLASNGKFFATLINCGTWDEVSAVSKLHWAQSRINLPQKWFFMSNSPTPLPKKKEWITFLIRRKSLIC